MYSISEITFSISLLLFFESSFNCRGVFPEPYRRDNTYDHLRGDDDEDMEEGGTDTITL